MTTDITLIKQTLAAYCHRVDRGSAEEVAQLFHRDAVLRPHFDANYEVRGQAAIRDWFAYYHEHLRANVRHLRHSIGSILIDLDGDRARSVAYLWASFVNNADETACFVTGTYTDELVRESDAWLFKDRLIEASLVMSSANFTEKFPPLGWPGAPAQT